MSLESEWGRAIGQVEGKLEGIVATLKRVDERSKARDEAFEEIREELRTITSDIGTLKKHAADSVEIALKFNALQQSIRDGANQAKGIGKGFSLGVAFAAAGTGAAVAGFGREIWRLIFGGP